MPCKFKKIYMGHHQFNTRSYKNHIKNNQLSFQNHQNYKITELMEFKFYHGPLKIKTNHIYGEKTQ